MKNVHIFLLLILLVPQIGFSQLNKGDALIGGTIGISSSSSKNDFDKRSDFSVHFAPKIGFFVLNKLAVGTDILGSYFHNDSDYNSTSIGLGPLARYYFKDGKVAPFGQISGRINWNAYDSFSSSGGKETIERQSYNLGLAAGVNYFFNENVALEASLNYGFQKSNDLYSRYNTLNLQIGVATFIH